MKRLSKAQWGWQAIAMVFVTVALMLLVFFSKEFSLIGLADSTGKVTASTANIRKEANPNSEIVGSTSSGKEVSIKSQTTGTDGKVWYQVYVDANTMGYIRSDLLKITDGSTPATDNSSPAGTDAGNTEGSTPATADNVTAVNPTEGKVKGSDSVRVRSDASTNGNNIVTTAARGQKVTIIGTAKDGEGKDWYQVTFDGDGGSVTGFIRSDYVKVSGEISEAGAGTETTEAEPEKEPEKEPVKEESKPYYTALSNGNWYLCDVENDKQYNIVDFISANEQYSILYNAEKATVKKQKIAIVVMAGLLVLLGIAVALLIFKMKDAADSMYFRQVEQETIRRRTADRPQRAPYSKPGQQQAQGQKEARTSQNAPRPAGNQPGQGKRPATNGGQQRMAGAQQTSVRRPASQAAPQGSVQGANGQGTRRQAPAGQRPANPQARPEGQPVRKAVAPQRPVENQPREGVRPTNPQGAGQARKAKNFMQDDDEFEFAFLNNWEDEE